MASLDIVNKRLSNLITFPCCGSERRLISFDALGDYDSKRSSNGPQLNSLVRILTFSRSLYSVLTNSR